MKDDAAGVVVLLALVAAFTLHFGWWFLVLSVILVAVAEAEHERFGA